MRTARHYRGLICLRLSGWLHDLSTRLFLTALRDLPAMPDRPQQPNLFGGED